MGIITPAAVRLEQKRPLKWQTSAFKTPLLIQSKKHTDLTCQSVHYRNMNVINVHKICVSSIGSENYQTFTKSIGGRPLCVRLEWKTKQHLMSGLISIYIYMISISKWTTNHKDLCVLACDSIMLPSEQLVIIFLDSDWQKSLSVNIPSNWNVEVRLYLVTLTQSCHGLHFYFSLIKTNKQKRYGC